MTRIATTYYGASPTTQFQWATAGSDQFSRIYDLYYLAQALEYHDHSNTRGLAVARVADGSLTAAAYGALSIGAAALADGAVTEAKILNGAITNGKIGDAAVSGSKIALDSILTDRIVNDAVTGDKLGINYAILQHSTSQALGVAGTGVDLNFDTEIADVGGWHSGSSPSLIFPEAGIYVVVGFAEIQGGEVRLGIYNNAGQPLADQNVQSGGALLKTLSVTAVTSQAAGDYVRLNAVSSLAGALVGNTYRTRFAAWRIS
jgi:hypothetical protein